MDSEDFEGIRSVVRDFVRNTVVPVENDIDEHDEVPAAIREAAKKMGLFGFALPEAYGGLGLSMEEESRVVIELGYTTPALRSMFGTNNGIAGHVLMEGGTPRQKEEWLPKIASGDAVASFALTEADAGSDPSTIATTAVRTDAGWRINGEKWFVTSGDVARVLVVMANVLDGDEQLPTLFLIEPGADGVAYVDDPKFTHNYPHGHPTIRFTDVEVADDAVIGGIGNGEQLQRRWFTEERLGIATHGLGAMWRLVEESTAWVLDRVQSGHRLMDYQGISFPLADSATDATVGRLLALHVCQMVDANADPKLIHAKASMAKLFVSEAAGRCADRAVQAFGGRGYMRSNVAERFQRELRVDRIWEGTSEIQRLIVARSLERRGVEATIH